MLAIQTRLATSITQLSATVVPARLTTFCRHSQPVFLIIFFTFLMRHYLSLWKPYWYAELLSVIYYGSNFTSLSGAIEHLANRSIHPPLYQLILYGWMRLFGDSEVATRSLSNLYVSCATLCLYVLTYKVYARRLALAVAILFSLMYMPFYFAMVSRSYAQTLFLSSLSSLLLFYFVEELRPELGWKKTLLKQKFLYLIISNTALLLTHYYNVFFLAAQGVFLLLYMLHGSRGCRPVSTVAKVAVVTATPVLLMLAVWGPTMARSYRRFSGGKGGRFVAEAPSLDPWSIFMNFVVDPNLKQPALVLVLLSTLLLVLLLRSAATLYERGATSSTHRQYCTYYFVIWALVPCLIAYLLFFVGGAERYKDRYFIFCTPPLAVLLALAMEEGVRLAHRMALRLTELRPARHYLRYALPYMLIATALLVVPQGQKAATKTTHDFRGIAAQIVNLVQSDPDHSYLVYEASHRRSLDYYLARFSDDVRVHNTVKLSQEATGEFPFEQQASEIAQHDYFVLAFSYHRAWQFPKTVQKLSELYGAQVKLLDGKGRGLMVFKIAP